MSLSMPLKVHELLQTVEMMDYTITRRRKSSGKGLRYVQRRIRRC